MKEFFVGLIVGVVLTVITGWYFLTVRHLPVVRQAQDSTATTLRQTADTVEAKLVAWHLTNADIEQELKQTGKVVRRQMRELGATVADATADARITAQIKGKLALNRELSAKSIAVSTTDGRVTLSGTVANAKLIGKALALALETEGVREAAATLKVK